MIDFELTTSNLLREGKETVTTTGAVNPKLGNMRIVVQYRLHRDEFPDPQDPEGTPLDLFCLHLPQIEMSYVDESEERVFEAMHELFEEDLVRYYANRAVETMQIKENERNKD